jgi:hypothetical protein
MGLFTVPLLLVGVLYLMATGRWGSYVSVPGTPVYVTDVVLLVALAQTIVRLRLSGPSFRAMGAKFTDGHIAFLLCLVLLAWTALRAVIGIGTVRSEPLIALRDLAPYGYCIAAVLAFVWGPLRQRLPSALVYSALCAHVCWLLLARYLPGWPSHWLALGGAPIFTARADFDATVLGIAVALALHRLLFGGRELRPWARLALVGFVVVNAYALTTMPSRAGLIASLVAIACTLLSWTAKIGRTPRRQSARRRRHAAILVTLLAVVAVTAISPAGQRLQEGLRGDQGVATGTVHARQAAWEAVERYVRADASRTAIGVGFGPNFLSDSGGEADLEGTSYENVRSPHNYVLGTVARLGVAGGLIATALMVSAASLAIGLLRRTTDTPTVFAGLIVLSLPVPALLGVILEAPFGALPYFWAIGHLAMAEWSRRHRGELAS